MPFTYQPYRNPYVGQIADLMQAPGRAQAQAALQSGAAWGNAANQIGQGVAGTLEHAVDPRTQLEAEQLQKAKQARADLAALDQAYQQPGGRDAILNALPGHLRPQVQEQFDTADARAAKMRADQLAYANSSGEYLSHLAQTVQAHGFDPGAAQLAISHAKDAFSKDPAALQSLTQAEAAIQQQPTPETVKAVVSPFLEPQLMKLGRGETVTDLGTGNVVARGGAEPPTEASLAVAAAGGDPNAEAALAKLKTPTETPDQKALRDAQLKEINARLSGTMPMSPKDRAELEMQRERLAQSDPTSDKNQQKLEQQYRGVLQRTLSSRSGGLGLEDQKVNQALHLLAIFDQNKDPQTGEYKIPKMMVNELALGLARLTSPSGQVGLELERDLNQRTAKGDLAGAITYLTGTPVTGSTQDVLKMFRDSIERQGRVAEQNREGYFNSIRAMAPTDLDEGRKSKVEQALKLNALPKTAAPPAGAGMPSYQDYLRAKGQK